MLLYIDARRMRLLLMLIANKEPFISTTSCNLMLFLFMAELLMSSECTANHPPVKASLPIRNLCCILVCLDSAQCVCVCVCIVNNHIRFLLASQRTYTLNRPAVSVCVPACACVHRGLETGRGSGDGWRQEEEGYPLT